MTKEIRRLIKKSVLHIAEKKASANCTGFMYEPKKPDCLIKKK